jgi:dCTP deaminase
MILTGSDIQARLTNAGNRGDPLVIVPLTAGSNQVTSSSVDLRLGTWFAAPRPSDIAVIELSEPAEKAAPVRSRLPPGDMMDQRFIPFGARFILHPNSFVLAATLEWIRLPADLAASVEGRSSLGRCGLNIATATTVHPHFTGCLTLELTNMGEVPISISPGMLICQLILHQLTGNAPRPDHSSHSGYRRPIMNPVHLDSVARKLGAVSQGVP